MSSITIGAIPDHSLMGSLTDGRLLFDGFDRADATNLAGAAIPKSVGSATWSVTVGGWDNFSNGARNNDPPADISVLVSTGVDANVRMLSSRVTIDDNFTAFVFRFSDSDNYWVAGPAPFALGWYMYKNVGGIFTQVASASDSDTPGAGDTIINFELQCSTINIVVYEDGIERLRSTGDSFNDGADGVGFYADPSVLSTATSSLFDDITVTRLADGIVY